MKRIVMLAGVVVFFALETANAGPFSLSVQNDVYAVAQGGGVNGIPTARDDNDGLPDINDAANLLYSLARLGSPFGRNHNLDPLFVSSDEIWQELGGGTVALIGLTAGNSNTIGVYTDLGVGSVRTNVLGPNSGFGFVGGGTVGSPFPAGLTGLSLGQPYGWFLNSFNGASNTLFFSEPFLNSDSGIDHLMTFDMSALASTTIYINLGSGAVPFTLGSSTFLLGWEDLPFDGTAAGDDDYDDMIYLITNAPRDTPEPSSLGLLVLAFAGVALARKRSR